MLTIDDLWWRIDANLSQKEYRNCSRFVMMLNALPKKVAEAAYHPNKEKAPWHIQFNFGEAGIINVWPHKRRYQRENEPSVLDDAHWTNLGGMLRLAAARHFAQTGRYHNAPTR